MTPIINVENLKKSYGDKDVLKDVNMQVAPGSVFALLGSNGAGKTTIINILTSLLPADGGKCTVAGFDVATEGEKVRQAISLTGQFAAVDDILTGRENLELIARLRREPEPKQVAAKMLSAVSLVAAADKPVGTYSGGMRRRIDIAMSLIGAPQVIFLDEPTTGLDPEARNEVYALIRQLVAQGTTIFLTTQYLKEAEILADRIGILHEGTIVANGTFAELKALFPAPKVEYVEKQPSLEEIFLAIVSGKGDINHD